MSIKERAIQMILDSSDEMSEYLLLLANTIGEIAVAVPDEIDMAMMEQAKKENDGQVMTLKEVRESLGLVNA